MLKIVFVATVLFANSVLAADVVPHVHLVRGEFAPGSQPDGNSVILDAPQGLVVVDTGRHTAHTQKILEIAKRRERPIVAVINTHWHLDHIGGNALVRRDYPAARIHASAALGDALGGFLANYRKQLVQVIENEKDPEAKRRYETEVALIDAGPKLAPDVVITRSGKRTIGGRELTIGLESDAVTAGDVWVLDETSKVLIAGDLITLPAPFLDTACPKKWRASLDRLAALDFDLVIPGHGAPLTRAQFHVYRQAFAALLDCKEKERCIDAWVKSIEPLVTDLDVAFTRSLMSYYVDLLQKPPARCE